MAGFYDDMAQMTRELLAPTDQGGLGQGVITLTQVRAGTPDPAKPWEPVTPVTIVKALRGAVRGVDSRLVGTEVGSTVLQSTDRVAICEPPPMQYEASDILTVDGVPMTVLAVERIPAAGIVSAVRFTIRA